MYTVTFYSYKGGVGRTLALMNVAARLARKGKAVFVLDFDLEAPGIDVFSADRQPHSPGLLEYISEYSKSRQVPPLETFVSKMSWEGSGSVFYMSAGRRDAQYQQLLAQLNWKDFYSHESGYLFVENLKGAIRSIYSADYVLVDSRTGMTDISGICTLQLPDLVVFVFGLNEQNLLGTSQIYQSVRHNPLFRPIETLLVASPVPDVPKYLSIRKQRLDRAKELLGDEPSLVLPYDPFVAFSESVSTADVGEYLSQAYDQLCDKIIETNASDLTTRLDKIHRLRESVDVELVDALYKDLIETHPGSGMAWLDYGNYLRSVNEHDRAITAYKQAAKFDPVPRVWRELTQAYLATRRIDEAREALRKYLPRARNVRVLVDLGDAFGRRDETDAAVEIYKTILAGDARPEHKRLAEFELGNLSLRRNDATSALEYFRQTIEDGFLSLASAYNIAVAQWRLGLHVEARENFTKALMVWEQRAGPRGLPAEEANKFQAMSQACRFLGHNEKSVALMQQAIILAESASSLLYSSFQYRYISMEEFVGESNRFLQETRDGGDQERSN